MLNLQQIISEADILVPNVLAPAEKVTQLNAINSDFFNGVKIPVVSRFTAVSDQPNYPLPTDVRAKNIDLVECGLLRYRDLLSDDITPTQIAYSFDDSTSKLTLSPAPYQNGLQGIVRYRRFGTNTFTSGNLSASPDAPTEYHWTYVLALAAWIAQTQDDAAKAAMYEAQYKSAWSVAAQNYQTGG